MHISVRNMVVDGDSGMMRGSLCEWNRFRLYKEDVYGDSRKL